MLNIDVLDLERSHNVSVVHGDILRTYGQFNDILSMRTGSNGQRLCGRVD